MEPKVADEKIQVCLPRFGAVALLILRWQRSGKLDCIHVGTWPRYLRAALRIGLIRESSLLRWAARAAACRVVLVVHEQHEDYPALNLGGMTAVVPATLALRKTLTADPWVAKLACLIGQEPAEAYAMQMIAHLAFWPQLLQLAGARAMSGRNAFFVVGPASWSDEALVALESASGGVHYLRWPGILRRLARLGGAVTSQFGTLGRIVRRTARAGLRRRPAVGPLRRLAVEFIEPERLRRRMHDADFLVDDKTLLPSDLLLYLTREQEERLRRKGVDLIAARKEINNAGYTLTCLGESPLSMEAMARALRSWRHRLTDCWRSPWSLVYGEGISRYLEFAGLFSEHRFANIIYPKFPNGDTSWRVDSAIVTGLARAHGTVSVGVQTRVVYAAHYEFAFDCHDRFFTWGPAWYEALAPTMAWAGKVESIGCIYLDGAVIPRAGTPTSAGSEPAYVLLFTGDIGGSHYTLAYNQWFLALCRQLAAAYPNLEFRVKCKDPEHADVFEAGEISARREGANLVFLRQSRHNYRELLDRAAAVIAIGYTSPGVEAMLLGKPSIYVSALHGGGEAFAAYPSWVASSASELEANFARAWETRDAVDDSLRHALDGLDGFRDGRSRERLRSLLFT